MVQISNSLDIWAHTCMLIFWLLAFFRWKSLLHEFTHVFCLCLWFYRLPGRDTGRCNSLWSAPCCWKASSRIRGWSMAPMAIDGLTVRALGRIRRYEYIAIMTARPYSRQHLHKHWRLIINVSSCHRSTGRSKSVATATFSIAQQTLSGSLINLLYEVVKAVNRG